MKKRITVEHYRCEPRDADTSPYEYECDGEGRPLVRKELKESEVKTDDVPETDKPGDT